jgi:hypothetical protein
MGSMTDAEIASVVAREITQAAGYESDTLSSMRSTALDYYQGVMPDAAAGRSNIVSNDVADSIHSILAQVCPILKTSQVEFEANSQEDEEQAQTETDFTQVMIERSCAYNTLFDATHDALLLSNGWIYVGVDTETVITEDKYPPGLPEEALFMLGLQYEGKVDIKEGKEYTLVTNTREVKKLRVEACPPEDMLYSESGAAYKIDEVRFVARRKLYTASALIGMGIPASKVEALQDASQTTPDLSRQGALQNDNWDLATQDAERLKVVYDCYIRLSPNDNNESELRHVWVGDNSPFTLKNESAKYVPYITGSAIPMPHRILGISIYDLLKNIQLGKTGILRQYMDNLAVMNASRLGVIEGQVNMKDLTDGRINGIVRMRSPDSIMPLPASDIGQQAMAGLSYLDQVRTQRVGSAVDFNEVQSQLMGTSATAAAGQLAKVEQMSGWFATNIARTLMLPMFKAVHRVLRTELAGVVNARIGGKWKQTDTSQWQERDTTNINMGMTTVEKAERMQGLTSVITSLTGMLGSGGNGIITDHKRLYNALADWIRTANLGKPDQYLIDPSSQEAQAAAQQQQQQAQDAARQKLDIDIEVAKIQQDFELEKQRRELNYKVWSDKLDAEVEEAKITSSSVIEVKKLSKDTESNDRAIADTD